MDNLANAGDGWDRLTEEFAGRPFFFVRPGPPRRTDSGLSLRRHPGRGRQGGRLMALCVLCALAGTALCLRLGVPLGAILLASGIIFMVLVGRRFLPARGLTSTEAPERDLAQIAV